MYSINCSNDKVDWKRKMGSAKHFSQGKTATDYKKEETVWRRRGLQGPKKDLYWLSDLKSSYPRICLAG